jgi:hypothetical protein
MKTRHPRLRSDSDEALSTKNLDPRKSPTRTTQGRAGRPPLIHLPSDKAFNATNSTNMATAPPAWEQRPCLILLFTVHSGMAVKSLPLFTSRRALFYHRRPLDVQDDNHHAPGFLGLGIIRSSSTPSATPRPGLDHRRSTKEQRLHVGYRGSHARHSTQDVSPSQHRHRHDTPGMADHYQGTSLQRLLQYPPNLLLQDIDLGFFVPLGLHLSL